MSNNNLKTTLLYYDNNIFINQKIFNVYLYFTNTKKILSNIVKKKLSRIDELKEYVDTNREKGNKIMLIVGANPDEKNHFIIPEKYVPVYVDINDTYSKQHNKFENEPFDNHPFIICNIIELHKYEYIKYDLIIFDMRVCKFIDFNLITLTNLFKITYDNTSLIIIDPEKEEPTTCTITQNNLIEYNNELDKKIKFFVKNSTYKKRGNLHKFPCSLYKTNNVQIVIEYIIKWFKFMFNNNLYEYDIYYNNLDHFNINSYLSISDNIDIDNNLYKFDTININDNWMENYKEQYFKDEYYNNKLICIFCEYNLYYSKVSPYYNYHNPGLYIYITNTKTINMNKLNIGRIN